MNFFQRLIEIWREMERKQKGIILGTAGIAVVAVVAIAGVAISVNGNKPGTKGDTESLSNTEVVLTETLETESGTENSIEEVLPPDESSMTVDTEDPQQQNDGNMTQQSGASVDFADVIDEAEKNSNETQEITYGIDVAKYQGTIDWKQVAESGVDFVMVRVGYRTLKNGEIVADSNAKYNMQEAQKYGIKVGAYFFSTAVTEAEAIEEADWVTKYISGYQITYPVAYNCEGFEDSENRQYGLSNSKRTDLAIAFMNRIAENGYSPMFYASKNEMENSAKWDMSRIESAYKVWVAQYPSTPYPETQKSSYTGRHDMWQYTNQGTVPGINKPVDVNIAYFGFHNAEGPKGEGESEEVDADPEALMNFKSVNEVVTAKERTNLRNKPSQGSDSTVMYTLTNGETATRTGISESGWSRVVFNGQTYYAVSSYLTTDLSVKTPESEKPEESEIPDSETESEKDTETGTVIKTQFVSVNEKVTAKVEVNLRTMPSVTNENSQIVATIKNGEIVTRTGINTDVGWSRVEYNGQILYCVSSYIEVVNDAAEDSVQEEQ